MFVFLLISAELALLYVVFWYLYVRDPKCKERIKGDLWGAYEGADTSQDYCPVYQEPACVKVDQTAYAHAEEFIWDSNSNSYIPVSQYEAMSLLAKMAAQLDRQLSQLNVKP